jgi:UDP:flavonoid glycosyltransferase YjiC (YdhE family)
MGGTAKETSAIVYEALARSGEPAIVQSGYSGLSAAAPNVLNAGFIPHDYLFERSGCVVHHAGAGTSTAAARAGAPSVTVPHLFDQYYWAGMLHERCVAPKPIFRPQLNAKKLADRITEALAMREAAQVVGSKIRAENGVENAIQELIKTEAIEADRS